MYKKKEKKGIIAGASSLSPVSCIRYLIMKGRGETVSVQSRSGCFWKVVSWQESELLSDKQNIVK